jgi:hypothetical protein
LAKAIGLDVAIRNLPGDTVSKFLLTFGGDASGSSGSGDENKEQS